MLGKYEDSTETRDVGESTQGVVMHGNGKGLERIWVDKENLLVRIVNHMDRGMV